MTRVVLESKTRVFEVVEVASPDDLLSRVFDLSIMTLIVLNVLAFVLGTVEAVYELAPGFFWTFEVLSVGIFTVEYGLRLWSCTSDAMYNHPLWGRLRYAATPFLIIDLLAILPFYLPVIGLDLRFIRMLRLFRLFRVAKLARYSQAMRGLGRALTRKKEELIITLSVVFLLLLLASSMMYFAEHEAQPEYFSSIPAAMWWGVATLTAVGYGDVYPVTAAGKMLASLAAILGIGMFALPTSILGAGFVEEIQGEDLESSRPSTCPHCGEEL